MKLNDTMVIDLDQYQTFPQDSSESGEMNLTQKAKLLENLTETGIVLEQGQRAATLIVGDHQLQMLQVNGTGYDFMPISEALQRFPEIKEKYYFKAMTPEQNEYVKRCGQQEQVAGYYLKVQKGVKVVLPCQAAMYMTRNKSIQYVHNIIVLEEDAELTMITGCSTETGVDDAVHISVEEHYIGKGARLIANMVHAWGKNAFIYPNAASVLEARAQYETNYVVLKPAKCITTNPLIYLNGAGAKYKSLTVAVCQDGCTLDMGGWVYLNAKDTGAELIQRGVCTGGALHQNGLLIGHAPGRAHVDCAGMILAKDDNGYIESIPGLKSYHPDARMSHEASIGKISPEQLAYLMSRGLTEQEALSLMIRGFLGDEIQGLGAEIDKQVAEIVALAGHGEA